MSSIQNTETEDQQNDQFINSLIEQSEEQRKERIRGLNEAQRIELIMGNSIFRDQELVFQNHISAPKPVDCQECHSSTSYDFRCQVHKHTCVVCNKRFVSDSAWTRHKRKWKIRPELLEANMDFLRRSNDFNEICTKERLCFEIYNFLRPNSPFWKEKVVAWVKNPENESLRTKNLMTI